MSSETKFAISHSSFWNALLPMGEAYVRVQNAKLKRFAPPISSVAPPNQRGIVNEGGFLIFQESMRLSQPPSSLPAHAVEELLFRAVEYVAKLRSSARILPEELSDAGRLEAILIAERLHTFFTFEPGGVIVRPPFPGCGWLGAAEGDVLDGFTLYEVKAGQRQFRLADLKQILCYCALDFSSKTYGIEKVSLLNPRGGIVIEESLDSLCHKLSGTGSSDVLGEIIGYISEPLSRYQPV